MYDVGQLAETIWDSIQKTLQKGFTGEGGDPDALDIWYYMEGDQTLEFPILGLSWPIDQPYQWAGAETETCRIFPSCKIEFKLTALDYTRKFRNF